MTVQAQNTAAAKNAATKVNTEENASEYNPANVKPIDKIDQTTAVVENAQGKEQSRMRPLLHRTPAFLKCLRISRPPTMHPKKPISVVNTTHN